MTDRDRPGGDRSDDAEPIDADDRIDGQEREADPEPGEGGAGTDGDDGDDDRETVEPIEVLVEMAREGEIDPWDIDVVHVTDRFLERIEASDLQASGRALFYASVLVRMKSDALLADEEEAPADDRPPREAEWMAGGDGAGGDGNPGADPIDGLEREIERRLDRKSARGTPETLDELVRELREVERTYKDSREYDTSDAPSAYRRGTQTLDYRAGDDLREAGEPLEEEVTGTAHGEDVEQTVSAVRATLDEQYDAGREEVLFAEVHDAGGSRVETYLGVLFLAHRGHVDLRQDELFGDLWIRDPAAPPVADEDAAVAD